MSRSQIDPSRSKATFRIGSKPLPVSFYRRNTLEVACDLLGKVLWICPDAKGSATLAQPGLTAARITETEAYRADDPASHSARGRTDRSAVMFGPPGRAYVYFIYGMYEMLNFVTEPEGDAGAVLIRAAEPILGEELMRLRRKKGGRAADREELARGPGKLCRAMGVRLDHNGEKLSGPRLLVTDDGFRPERVMRSPRVGISKAKDQLWRYFIAGSGSVSRVRENALGVPL